MRVPVLSLLVLLAVPAFADEPMCGNGPETDAMLQRMAARSAQRSRIGADAVAPTSILRDGTFYLEADSQTMSEYRRLDLGGQSLVFEPRGATKFATRRTALQYTEPSGEPIAFSTAKEWFVKVDLTAFALPLFGKSVTTVYVTAYNGIHLSPPAAESEASQVDALEAAVQRQAVLSPLLMTKSKPKNLPHPDVYVNESANALVVTWRSTKGKYFGFDVQATLRADGSIVYSYKTLRNIEWGTPILTSGFDAAAAEQRLLQRVGDTAGDVVQGANGIGAMGDITQFEVFRVGESDLLLYRLKLARAIDPSAIVASQPLRYWVTAGIETVQINVERGGATNVYAPGRPRFERNSPVASYRDDVVELFVNQDSLLLPAGPTQFRAFTDVGGGVADVASLALTLDPPARRISSDLSQTAGAEMQLPIAEPFVLGALDVSMVWRILKASYGLRDDDIDGLAIYQAFYTDLIFYAGAYSTVGNPQVNGIGSRGGFGSAFAKTPALLHMSHFTYGYNSAEKTASQVALHEFGHRWLYHTSIRLNGASSRVLNPVSAHPAQYVHMPAAFKVYDDAESSTMGGAFFTQQGDGSWIARVANAGFTWIELYLMGLASPSEVPPWFFLDGTQPALGGEYWPLDKQVVTGTPTNVGVEQIIGASGERKPSAAGSQRGFRVPFVIVTYPGELATPEQVAQMTALRAVFEKNFALATGGRAAVTTHWPLPRRRSAR